MNINKIKRSLLQFYINSRGWNTNRKLMIIESDDWGSIRMPSNEIYYELLKQGFPVDKHPYLKYDAIESNEDLECLFNVLESVVDEKGRHPIITANTIVSNPDFESIAESGFQTYYNESFIDTLNKYPNRDKVFSLYQQGIKKNIFKPQLHGLEHLNRKRWMSELQNPKSIPRELFNFRLFDLGISHTKVDENSFMDSLNIERVSDVKDQKVWICDATTRFYEIFGYYSETFIAPRYIWHPKLEQFFGENGINGIQSGTYQLVPKISGSNEFKKVVHFTGKKNKYGQIYTVRNCFFEPSSKSNHDTVSSTLKQVHNAFKKNKPAIICSHRINYIGSIDITNRINNLRLLKRLMAEVKKNWPNVEFLSTDELLQLIKNDHGFRKD